MKKLFTALILQIAELFACFELYTPVYIPFEENVIHFNTKVSMFQYDSVLSGLTDGVGSIEIPEMVEKYCEDMQINENVCSVLYAPELGVLESIVRSSDNKDYLRTNLHGESDAAGVAFFDYRMDTHSTFKLIHGHNLGNEEGFAKFTQYFNKFTCNSIRPIYLMLDGVTYSYKVYSVCVIDVSKEALPSKLPTTYQQIKQFMRQMKDRSEILAIEPTSLDNLVIDTCWYGESGQEHNLHCIISAFRV